MATQSNRAVAPISVTMSILAVLLGAISLMGHRAHTDEILQLREKYAGMARGYRQESAAIEEEARQLEQETDAERHRADRLDLGEGFLEVALVITSLTLITRRRIFWLLGAMVGITGLIVGATGLWV